MEAVYLVSKYYDDWMDTDYMHYIDWGEVDLAARVIGEVWNLQPPF